MDFVGIENITPFDGVYEYKVYKYSDEVDMNDKNSLVCNLKVIITKISSVYTDKFKESCHAVALIENLNDSLEREAVKDSVKEFILQEIYEHDLEKENIDTMFIQKG